MVCVDICHLIRVSIGPRTFSSAPGSQSWRDIYIHPIIKQSILRYYASKLLEMVMYGVKDTLKSSKSAQATSAPLTEVVIMDILLSRGSGA